MNQKIKFLELVLSDLVSERDTLEMDLNEVLNSPRKKTQTKKDEFKNVLGSIVETNNKIKTLTEYLSTPDLQYNEGEKGSNNNK